jgi:hypothetical protein
LDGVAAVKGSDADLIVSRDGIYIFAVFKDISLGSCWIPG